VSGGWRVLTGWGLLLVALAAVEVIFGPNGAELALLGGAGVGVATVGLLMLIGERRAGRAEDEALPEGSLPTVVAAFGLAILVLGWKVGPWMTGVGAGLLVAGLGGVVRELRAQRS
jgi:hypothetical protein